MVVPVIKGDLGPDHARPLGCGPGGRDRRRPSQSRQLSAGAGAYSVVIAQVDDHSHTSLAGHLPAHSDGNQVIDSAGGHVGDVGLHHHRVQRLVDAAAWSEDQRKE